MTVIHPDPDDPGEASQFAGLAALMQIALEQASAADTVTFPAVTIPLAAVPA